MRNFIALIVTFVALVGLAHSSRIPTVARLGQGWEKATLSDPRPWNEIPEEAWHSISHPATAVAGERGVRAAYRITLPDLACGDDCHLFLQWVQDSFRVLRDGREIFRSPDFADLEVRPTLRRWWMVPLGNSASGARLVLEVRPSSGSLPSLAGMPLVGACHELVRGIFIEEIYKLSVAAMSFLFGILVLIFYASTHGNRRTWLSLGASSLFFGVWVVASAGTRTRLFFYDNPTFWIHLDHGSLLVFGTLMIRSHSLMGGEGQLGLQRHYGRFVLYLAPVLLLATGMGLISILALLPLGQLIITLGVMLALADGVFRLVRRSRQSDAAIAFLIFGLCGLNDMLMDLGLVPWVSQLTPIGGLLVIFGLGGHVGNAVLQTQQSLALARLEATESRLRALNAMLGLADRFNSPVTGIMNHAELLLKRLPRLEKAVGGEPDRGAELTGMRKGLEHIKASADELRSLSDELSEYRESEHAVRASDLELRKNLS